MESSVPNASPAPENIGPAIMNEVEQVAVILAAPVDVAAMAAIPQDPDAGLGDGLLGGDGTEATERTGATKATVAVETTGVVPADSSQDFFVELEAFFKHKGVEFRIPKFYGVEVDLSKLWSIVCSYGGYEKVTVNKLWRVVGDNFDPPKSCTTLSWSFRGFYEKALLDYEKSIGAENLPPGLPHHQAHKEGETLRSGKRAKAGGATQMQGGSDGEPNGSPSAKRLRQQEGEESLEMETGGSAGLEDMGAAGQIALKLRGGTPALSASAARSAGTWGDKAPNGSTAGLAKTQKGGGGHSANGKAGGVGGSKGLGVFEATAVVSDEGQPADWVRINVRRTTECFEVYALVPGLLREEVRVQCEEGGKLVIAGEPEQPENPWGVTAFKKVILLPSSINAHQTSAVVTLHGQLYVRAPIANHKSGVTTTGKGAPMTATGAFF